MNNKGQTLVIFIFLIPIILLLFLSVIDYGIISIQKYKAESSVKDSIKYALNNQDLPNLDNTIKDLLNKNIDNITNINIDINNDYISINLNIKENHLFNFLNINDNIKLSYTGTLVNNEIIIEKG